MSDNEAESHSHEEEEDESDDDVMDDQKIIFEHNQYLAEHLPGFLYAVKTCAREAGTKSLNLADLGLEASHLRQFFKLLPDTQITELNLEENDVRWILQEVAQQLSKSKVNKLCLKNCTIGKNDVLSLMKALKQTQVTDLDLSGFYNVDLMGKSATTFVSHLIKSRVSRLNLSGTSLMEHGSLGKHLARYLPHTSITYLDLSHSLRQNTKAINILFSSLPKSLVTELNLVGNEIKDDDLKTLCQNLQQSQLEVLDLHFNKITDVGLNMLAEVLIHSNLRKLGVCMNEIKGANNLGRCLKGTNISVLNLGVNKIESYEMFSFPDFLEGTSVIELGVNSSHLGDEAAGSLMKCLKNSKVTKLNVSGNKFGLTTISEFSEILKSTNITEINFSAIDLSAEAFGALGEGLKGSKLQKLKAGSSACKKEGSAVTALIEKSKGTALESLDISHTSFKNNDCKILAMSLMNTTFTHLNLRSCKIGAGIADLAPSLKHTAITHLDLSWNEIDDKGAEKLAECLKETQIIDLNVENNSIAIQGGKALVLSLKTSSLYGLNIGYNKLDEDDIEDLAEILEGTFITNLDITHNGDGRILPVLTVLWRNKFLVYKLVNFFKLIAPAANEGLLGFDRNVDGDFTKFVERCLLFYKAVIEQPSAIGALAQEESLSFTRKEVTHLILEEFPHQFALFIGSKIDVETTQHVQFVEKAEGFKLSKIVEHLLANRSVLMIEKKLSILHPAVYKLLVKYKLPICDSETEREGKSKVIQYFTEHPDIAGASDVLKILSD